MKTHPGESNPSPICRVVGRRDEIKKRLIEITHDFSCCCHASNTQERLLFPGALASGHLMRPVEGFPPS